MNKQQMLFCNDIVKRHCFLIRNSTRHNMYARRTKALDDISCMGNHFIMSLEMECYFERKISCACVESGHRPSEYSMAFGNKSSRRYN